MSRSLFIVFLLMLVSNLLGDTDGWNFVAVRPETAARSSASQDNGKTLLTLAGGGNPAVDGKWTKRFPINEGDYVTFTAQYRTKNLNESPARSVVATIVWLNAEGKEMGDAGFPNAGLKDNADGWRDIAGTYKVPAKAKDAQIELRLRWTADGEVTFRNVDLKPSQAPAARKVKIASIHHRPRGLKDSMANLQAFAEYIDKAGAQKADIICLPEGCTIIGQGSNYAAKAETVPGPSTEFLGQYAAKNHAYIVAGIYEKDGNTLYNTSVLLGRDGKLIGKYHKICLPRGEIDGGLAPGNEYPVFDLDFGRIAMMICWDVAYPEVARELSAEGAEIIFMPIWGGNETLCKARAIENQNYLVTSSYDLKSAIYDRQGEPLAQIASTKESGVVMAEIDLNQPTIVKWTGDWRSRIWIEGPVRK
jgi:predicted amidohydrolase